MQAKYSHTGFTLLEIMIVVAIVGLLLAIAIPSFFLARHNTENAQFINDLRVACAAFQNYTMDVGHYPPDGQPGVVPPGMDAYLAGMHWTETTPVGGQWDWDYQTFGFTAGVSVYFGAAMQDDRMLEIDQKIDDGNLATGSFRKRSQGYISIIEP